MKLLISFTLSCLVFFLTVTNLIGQTADFQKANLAAQLYVNKKANKGLVIGIIKDGTTKMLSYGQLSAENKALPDENTLFEIGSVTSVFTTSLMKLEEKKGLFKMEDRIQDHFSGDVRVPSYRPEICFEQKVMDSPMSPPNMNHTIVYCMPIPMSAANCITFCHLASHTSGFSNNPRGLYDWNPLKKMKQKKDPYQDFSKEELYQNMKKIYLNTPPGSNYDYSNWGIAILGNLVADIANQPYETLLVNQLLKPLGLKDTRIELSASQSSRLAIGHTNKGSIVEHWHFMSMSPALGLKSTANDLVAFVQANLTTTNPELENAFAHVQQAQIDTNEKKLGRCGQMGYGWFTSILNEATNMPIQWISGGTAGYRSFIGFNKDTHTGVVVLSNAANDVDELGFLFLEGLIGTTPKRVASK